MSATAYSLCFFLLLAGCSVHRRQTSIPDHGRIQFQNYCAACHRYDKQGMGDAPPLDASRWVTGPEDRLTGIVLHGLRGDREMPGFGQILSDTDVASLLSFVRMRFGPHIAPITPAAVSRVRAIHKTRTDYWSVEELLKIP